MPQAPPGARQIERRSLQIGVAASLLMAAMGISVYALSGSEALLLDGLYSGVMAASSFIAARIGANVVRPPDRAYPYGYDGQEALYVLFRSLVLIGILSVAVITAGTTIVNHLGGQAVEAVQLRPVAGYAGLMVVLCLALAWRHEHDWERSPRRPHRRADQRRSWRCPPGSTAAGAHTPAAAGAGGRFSARVVAGTGGVARAPSAVLAGPAPERRRRL
jgi:predicted Co/Zn/Cd cation transporter (cation efflux family)